MRRWGWYHATYHLDEFVFLIIPKLKYSPFYFTRIYFTYIIISKSNCSLHHVFFDIARALTDASNSSYVCPRALALFL